MFESFKRLRVSRAVCAIPLICCGHQLGLSERPHCQSIKIKEDPRIAEVSLQLKSGLEFDRMKLLTTTKEGIKVYYPKDNGGKHSPKGLPLARVAVAEINANIEEVCSYWEAQGNRKDWDSSLTDSQLIHSPDPSCNSIAYALKKSVYGLPPRDFAFRVHKSSGGVVGINDFNVVTYVNIDESRCVPFSWRAVRGHANSLLVLQPLGPSRTKAMLVVEAAPGGWLWLVPPLIDFLSGNRTIESLQYLKAALEKDENQESSEISIEEAARRRVQRKQLQRERGKQITLVDDVLANKEDLKRTVAMLEKKLAQLQADEAKTGLDLTELKNRVSADIKKAKDRLGSV